MNQLGPALYRRLQRLFRAMLLGQAVFLLLSVGLIMSAQTDRFSPELAAEFWRFVPFFDMGMLVLGLLLFNYQRGRAIQQERINTRLTRYFSAAVIRLALINGTALFNLAIFSLTADRGFLLLFGGVVTWYIVLRPTHRRLRAELKLPGEQFSELFGVNPER